MADLENYRVADILSKECIAFYIDIIESALFR